MTSLLSSTNNELRIVNTTMNHYHEKGGLPIVTAMKPRTAPVNNNRLAYVNALVGKGL